MRYCLRLLFVLLLCIWAFISWFIIYKAAPWIFEEYNIGNVDWIWSFWGIWLVILFAVMWHIAVTFSSDYRYDDFIHISTEKGPVRVAVSAVEDMLVRLLNNMENIKDFKVDILVDKRGKKPITVIAEGRVIDGPKVIDLSNTIIEILDERFKQMLSIKDEVKFEVNFTRIDVPSGKGTDYSDILGKRSFTCPRYPTSDE